MRAQPADSGCCEHPVSVNIPSLSVTHVLPAYMWLASPSSTSHTLPDEAQCKANRWGSRWISQVKQARQTKHSECEHTTPAAASKARRQQVLKDHSDAQVPPVLCVAVQGTSREAKHITGGW